MFGYANAGTIPRENTSRLGNDLADVSHLISDGPTIPLYRLFNPNTTRHLYTTSYQEYSHLGSIGWHQEGIAWHTPLSGRPVHRLFHGGIDAHLFTADQNEIRVLVERGWNDEGVLFYCAKGQVNNSEKIRLFHPGARVHLFTADRNEVNVLRDRGWNVEGTGFYGFGISSSIVAAIEQFREDSARYFIELLNEYRASKIVGEVVFCSVWADGTRHYITITEDRRRPIPRSSTRTLEQAAQIRARESIDLFDHIRPCGGSNSGLIRGLNPNYFMSSGSLTSVAGTTILYMGGEVRITTSPRSVAEMSLWSWQSSTAGHHGALLSANVSEITVTETGPHTATVAYPLVAGYGVGLWHISTDGAVLANAYWFAGFVMNHN